MRGLTIAVASSALILCAAASASATELQFSLSNSQGTFETFDLNSAAGMYDSLDGYIYFDTTNDTAGYNGAFFGDASTAGNFGTGSLNTAGSPFYGSVVTAFSDYVTVPFYSDSDHP